MLTNGCAPRGLCCCSDKMFGSINRKLREADVWCLDEFAELVYPHTQRAQWEEEEEEEEDGGGCVAHPVPLCLCDCFVAAVPLDREHRSREQTQEHEVSPLIDLATVAPNPHSPHPPPVLLGSFPRSLIHNPDSMTAWCQFAQANYRVGKNLKFSGLGFKGA